MVYCLRNELVEFLSFNHENGLTASLLHDLNVAYFNSMNKAYAIMAELYAIPLQRMTEDKAVGITEMACLAGGSVGETKVLLEGMSIGN